VWDTGEGISVEDLPHIWERFYRGPKTREQDSCGTGIGLALVKELTEAMHGSVAVESTQGEGSHFILRLPRSDATGLRQIAPKPRQTLSIDATVN
jgi:signal transduction histidine kinase